MTFKPPSGNDDRNDAEQPEGHDHAEGHNHPLVRHIPDILGKSESPESDDVDIARGPSQDDMDRSWDGYQTGSAGRRTGFGGAMWKYTVIGISLIVLVSLALGIAGPLVGRSRIVEPARQEQPVRVPASVLRVIDARTIVVSSGGGEQTVRLIGVEGPVFGGLLYNYAQQVSQSWIGGKDVLLETDSQDTDEQGRLLRYVYIDNIMINAALILNGLGKVEPGRPNVRYARFFADMERQARESQVGVWDPAYGAPASNAPTTDTEASLRSESHAGPPAL